MAAVTRVKCRVVSPPEDTRAVPGKVTEAVTAGDLLVQGASGWSKAPVNTVDPHGIALQDYKANQEGCSIGKTVEIDGFSGMTPGTNLHTSGSVTGGLDTTPPTNAVTRIRALSATRISCNFI